MSLSASWDVLMEGLAETYNPLEVKNSNRLQDVIIP